MSKHAKFKITKTDNTIIEYFDEYFQGNLCDDIYQMIETTCSDIPNCTPVQVNPKEFAQLCANNRPAYLDSEYGFTFIDQDNCQEFLYLYGHPNCTCGYNHNQQLIDDYNNAKICLGIPLNEIKTLELELWY